MNANKLVIGFSFFTALAGIAYWVSVFTGLFPVTELVPGYRSWFLSFPLADSWLFVCALLAAVYTLQNKRLGGFFAALSGAGLIFLGLYAFMYGLNTGLLFNLTIDELIEIGIKIYCLSAGGLMIAQGWRILNGPAAKTEIPVAR